jgi:hypothetical protein
MAPRPKLFVSKRRLQKERPPPRKTVLNFIADRFCSLERKHNRRTAPRPKLFVSTRRLEKKGHNPELSWVRVPMKMFSVARKLSTVFRRKERNFFGENIIGTKVKHPRNVLGSRLGEDFGFRDNNNNNL